MDPIRQLKIKTGAVQRMTKDVEYYTKEVDGNRSKLEEMRGNGEDEADLRRQSDLVTESENMVRDVRTRVKKFYDELLDLVESLGDDSNVSGTVEFSKAKEVLAAAQPYV